MLSIVSRPLRCLLFVLSTASSLSATPVINEIMYRPGTGYPEDTDLEFIELYNPGASAVDLSGWAITKGVDYTFPSGTSIAAGDYLVIAANPTTLKSGNSTAASATIVGPWTAGTHLANSGEKITLAQPNSDGDYDEVDSISYADEGDWATRTRDSLGGWSWATTANGSNHSLERRNPNLSKNTGQNWGPSSAAGGTPGAKNSLYSTNVAPLITGVEHSPAVPTSSDPVTISANLTDELGTSAESLAATLYWRNATSTSPGSFTAVAMTNDGTGSFSATLAALAAKQIVEFYIAATDGTNTRTWPAANSEGQTTNCTYQVDDEAYTGTAPIYRLVLTAAENSAFTSLASSNPSSDRQFNVTLVAKRGDDPTIRYLCSMRIRGNSSRSYTYKPLHFSIPSDDAWDDVTSFNLNPKASYLQFLAMRLQRAAGFIAADASPIELRRQGVESTVSSGTTGDYGLWVRMEDFNADYLDNHFPTATSSQIYRKTSTSQWAYTSSTAPTDPDTTWSGWSKQSASAANDWSDVMTFTKVWQDTAASHFTGATSGNVSSGTWNGVAFTDTEVATLATVCDLDYLARWLALMTVMLNNEPNLSTGEDDDYAGAFINDGTNTRLVVLPHDMDTILGTGDGSISATAVGLYDVTETDTSAQLSSRSGAGSVTLMKPLLPLLGDSTRAGNTAFRTKYLTAIRELFGSVFDADTSSSSNPPFYQFVDNHLSAWASSSVRSTIKSFMTSRQTYLLGLIGSAKITPTAGTSTATATASSTPTLRINEVLAANTSIANGSVYPDLIELYNSGTSAISLAGYTLADDGTSDSETYTFPSGTTLAAGAYLTLYASTSTLSSGLNAGFALDAEGDAVNLYDSSGTLVDSITFGFQIPNYSISRTGTSAATWALTTPTFGAANGSAVTLGSADDLKLNEWAGHINFRVDHDFIELYNPDSTPVALGGVRLTDDTVNYPSRFVFPALSFIAPTGFTPLYGADFDFGLDGDYDVISLLGENAAVIDSVDCVAQPEDHSTGRTTDGGTTTADFNVPTPGLSNATTLPAAYSSLLSYLRISEIMYAPAASSSASNYEYIELQNIGSSTLDLSGVRFTNGIDYAFASGTTLAAGAYLVICKNRTAFLARYPGAAGLLAADAYSGALSDDGETLALTLPDPWYVHILKFRYESSWYSSTAGSGYSLVARAPSTTAARDWGDSSTWQASANLNGSPGFADSSSFTVSLGQSTAVTTAVGGTTLLSVSVSTSGTATYQWQQLVDGQWVDLSGATGSVYTISSTQSSAAGSYRCLVTVNGVTVASSTITLTVVSADASVIRLYNISTRALCLTGDSIVIPGFVISGSGTKSVVLRALGPQLTLYGVSGALADPTFTLKRYENSAWTDLATNDNWETNSNLSSLVSTQSAVGAVAYATGSKDAALLVSLAPGIYSAPTTGVNDGTGVAMLEIFDADSASTATCRLANLSTRGYVSTGDEVMIAGFVLDGSGTRQVLIRALGPTLTGYGVSGALADPKLTVYNSDGDVLGSNDDWGGSTSISTIATQVGAAAIDSTTKDAAILLTLSAGAYTVHIAGVGDTAGAAIVEIYDVP